MMAMTVFAFFLVLLIPVTVAFTRTSGNGASITQLSARSKSVPFLEAPKNLNGLIGNKEFDPIGFSDILDPRFLREAELKHCRLAMLGTLGFIITDFIRLPGDIHAISAVNAHNVAVGTGALAQVLVFVSALEAVSVVAVKETLEGKRAPGDFGFDPLGFSAGKSDKVKNDYALKELENGRLAMLAFGGIVTQAVVTGKGFPYF